MKLRLGSVLIETDYIEWAERASVHSVRIGFVSGDILEVHCAIKSTALATWELDAETLMQTLQNTDAVKLAGEKNGNS